MQVQASHSAFPFRDSQSSDAFTLTQSPYYFTVYTDDRPMSIDMATPPDGFQMRYLSMGSTSGPTANANSNPVTL